MSVRIAINGFGRIGRNIFRALFENKEQHRFELVAINDLGQPEINLHLARFDSVHGRFPVPLELNSGQLLVEGQKIQMLQQSNARLLPWDELEVDLVLECTGLFTNRQAAEQHLEAGAKKVIVSAPAKDVDATIVCGVNEESLKPEDKIISCGSCTTNCLSPLAKVLHQEVGIEQGMMTTVHAYTNDQRIHDSYHSDPYRARAAATSMIPSKTGAAKAVALVLPELAGKLDGMAVRVPTANVSVVDFNFTAKRATSVAEINQLMAEAAKRQPGILLYNDQPLVSVDFNHCSASSCFDASQTRVQGNLVKVMAWYDNEWGFSNRMLDLAALAA